MVSIERVFDAIRREREWQDKKWGTIEERRQQVGSYLTILRAELREAEDGWLKASNDFKALEELVQVAAVAVACLQAHGVVERPEIEAELAKDDIPF